MDIAELCVSRKNKRKNLELYESSKLRKKSCASSRFLAKKKIKNKDKNKKKKL